MARSYRLSPHHHTVYGLSGISQDLLGQWLGLQQPQISRIETGAPILNLDTLRYWARVLRIPPEWLWFDLLDQTTAGLRHPDNSREPVVLSSTPQTKQADAGTRSRMEAHGAGERMIEPATCNDAGHGGLMTLLRLLGLELSRDDFLGSNLDLLVLFAGEDGEETMERRAFILQAAVLAARKASGITPILEPARHDLHRSLADNPGVADVDEWREIAREYGQTYLTTAPVTLLGALLVDLGGVQLALQQHIDDETTKCQLLQAGALLAAFTAQTAANLGDLIEARRWWRTARLAADRSADLSTIFWVRGREVIRAAYEHRPVGAILQLITEAEARLDGVPPEALPEFFTGKAQTLALAGRHTEAELALYSLRELPVSSPHGDSLFDYAEENLYLTESSVYSHAGNFVKAERAQEKALTLYSDDNLRGRAQIGMQRALCLVRMGDLAQGARHAQETIINLPVVHRIRPIADLGQKVLGAIPARERGQAWVKEYGECLRVSLPGQPPNA
ncbi:MAG: helix-turn-helix domain-containing protein [Pseudonocardiaceae bacterium]